MSTMEISWVAVELLPWVSVAVKVRVNRCSPGFTSNSRLSLTDTLTALQASVATAISNGMSSSQEIVPSAGTLTKEGGVVSTTVMVWDN